MNSSRLWNITWTVQSAVWMTKKSRGLVSVDVILGNRKAGKQRSNIYEYGSITTTRQRSGSKKISSKVCQIHQRIWPKTPVLKCVKQHSISTPSPVTFGKWFFCQHYSHTLLASEILRIHRLLDYAQLTLLRGTGSTSQLISWPLPLSHTLLFLQCSASPTCKLDFSLERIHFFS